MLDVVTVFLHYEGSLLVKFDFQLGLGLLVDFQQGTEVVCLLELLNQVFGGIPLFTESIEVVGDLGLLQLDFAVSFFKLQTAD